MAPIEHIKMQSLSNRIGHELASRICAPIAFYMLLKANGYIDDSLSADDYILDLNHSQLSTDYGSVGNWSRPALSRYLRQKYGAGIVSWQFARNQAEPNLNAMKAAGYIQSSQEIEFYKSEIWHKSIKEIVREEYPVITTTLPGFSSPESKSVHAVIVLDWRPESVLIIDPDARNLERDFNPTELESWISPTGAGSVVLPPV